MQNILNDLKTISINDYELIYTYLKNNNSENCDYNICNIMSWGVIYKLEYSIYKNIIIFFNPEYNYLLFPELENISEEELWQIFNVFKEKYSNVQITPLSYNHIKGLPDIHKYFNVVNDTDWNDYVYLAENLVNLSGKKLAKKKNLISQFYRLYPDHKLVNITKDDYIEIMDFYSKWQVTHDIKDEFLSVEVEATKIILQNWDLFPCRGVKLYANKVLCAYAVWSPQTADMATVHFEKCDPKIKGSGQMINYAVAKDIAMEYTFVNREQDMGYEGIRHAKQSYQPLRMVEFYKLSAKI